MPPTLHIAMPTLQKIHAKTVICMLQAFPRLRWKHQFRVFEGMSNLDAARSILLTDWYDAAGDEDLFLFIDSDQTFTADDLNGLIDLEVDVAIGVVASRRGGMNVIPRDPPAFLTGADKGLVFGGTAVMMIRRPVLHQAAAFLAQENKTERIWVSQANPKVVPFFKQRFAPRGADGSGPHEWLGEDYSFCWLVRQVGGRIAGLLSPTIGHEMSAVKFVDEARPR